MLQRLQQIEILPKLDSPKAKQIVGLMDNIIGVTLKDPEALVKLSDMGGDGYEIRFSCSENTNARVSLDHEVGNDSTSETILVDAPQLKETRADAE